MLSRACFKASGHICLVLKLPANSKAQLQPRTSDSGCAGCCSGYLRPSRAARPQPGGPGRAL
eukprot:1599665-Rhodomonas_salina.7